MIILRKSFYILIMALIPVFISCRSLERSYHKVLMKGSVIESSDKNIYLCVGSADGAKAGDLLEVYRVEVKRNLVSPAHKHPKFIRKKVGDVKVIEIVDEHFAHAEILSGEARKDDLVELKK